ncbi:hypothetical protein AK830_g7424 [Neonectria ditissima]|uniref:Nudix hydrolase domain-containing protein n=1 Tax=Neonectria ditissima TaxID=78410 RepID=A0A0P7BE05_9HYPO|nr:hypothetical protein AK830_g7424 [Neonectria ditissima]
MPGLPAWHIPSTSASTPTSQLMTSTLPGRRALVGVSQLPDISVSPSPSPRFASLAPSPSSPSVVLWFCGSVAPDSVVPASAPASLSADSQCSIAGIPLPSLPPREFLVRSEAFVEAETLSTAIRHKPTKQSSAHFTTAEFCLARITPRPVDPAKTLGFHTIHCACAASAAGSSFRLVSRAPPQSPIPPNLVRSLSFPESLWSQKSRQRFAHARAPTPPPNRYITSQLLAWSDWILPRVLSRVLPDHNHNHSSSPPSLSATCSCRRCIARPSEPPPARRRFLLDPGTSAPIRSSRGPQSLPVAVASLRAFVSPPTRPSKSPIHPDHTDRPLTCRVLPLATRAVGQWSLGPAEASNVSLLHRVIFTNLEPHGLIRGERLVAGIVPLTPDQNYVLLIQSTRRKGWVLPKGGWESDETCQEAAEREAWEEAGITIQINYDLGDIEEKRPQKTSKDRSRYHFFEGTVTNEYEEWPERHKRERQWFTFTQAWEHLTTRPELQEALNRCTMNRL